MYNKKFNKIIVAGLLVVMTAAFAGCGSKKAEGGNTDTAKTETKLDKIKKSGKIVVGTSADYPPYEFHKVVDGKDTIVGFDLTIANEIAKDLGVKLEIKDMKFDGLIAALQCDNVDMVIAGMNPTEERKKNIDFSTEYYKAVQAIIVRTEDKEKIKSINDLAGKKVGAQKGTTQEEVAKDQMKKSEIKALGKVTDLVLELKNKKVDALVVELPVANAYISKNKDLSVADIKVENEGKSAAVALKKNSPELVEAINKTLDRLIKDNSIEKFVTEATNSVE